MGDTQWTQHTTDPTNSAFTDYSIDPAGDNPYSVAVSIINQIDAQFVQQGVKFVIQAGDLSDCGTDRAMAARAAAAATNLYPNNIGFFPMRGNHETYGGEYGPLNGYAINAIQTNFPQTQGNGTTWGATNFSSATVNGAVPPDLAGISYSFDYIATTGGSARFVILDTWATPLSNPQSASATAGTVNADGYSYGYTINQQQAWITQQLNSQTRGTDHAFVFAHPPLMAEDHQDTMFSGYTNANPTWQNAFYSCLMNNGAAYMIGGHDHMHQRSIIASPDGLSNVQELICASCSNKFYAP